jgi:hypothetical protein
MEEAPLTPGQKANALFVESRKNEHPGLSELIPEECQDCSSAWLHATRGNFDRVQSCPGRSQVIIGELTIALCRLPTPGESYSSSEV